MCVCSDVDECAEPSQCPGQMCVNTVGSYRCVSCRPGYTLINRQCAGTHTHTHRRRHTHSHRCVSDVDECEDSRACPAQLCVNTQGSFACVSCQQGYHTVNGVCTGTHTHFGLLLEELLSDLRVCVCQMWMSVHRSLSVLVSSV